MMKNYYLLILLFSQQIFAQTIHNKSKLDSVYNAFGAYDKAMFRIKVQKEGKDIYEKNIGFADLENETVPDDNTKYRIGSVTKTFTAVLIFKAIEEGKLKQTDKLSKFFPRVKNADIIQISNLLEHTSGIRSYDKSKFYDDLKYKSYSKELLLEMIYKLPSDFPPDYKFSYSNTGYALLGFILEKVYGKDYSEILKEKIIGSLNLQNTYTGNLTDENNNEAKSYVYYNNWRKKENLGLNNFIGAGNIVSTPSDINTFFKALFDGKLVSEKSLIQMKNLQKGLFHYPYESKNMYGHTGSVLGYLTFALYIPEDKIAICIAENGVRYDIGDILEYVLNDLYDDKYEIPDFKRIKLDNQELQQYVGKYKYTDESKDLNVYILNDKLYLQQGDSPEILIEAKVKNKFVYDTNKIELLFSPEKKKMTMTTKKGIYTYKKID
ncbi:MAG: peptidase [Chryseobacterium sp.]|nr:MAG: peptidase [Chryseobacterium sp.]